MNNEEIFEEKNGGKPCHISYTDGETFTSVFVMQVMAAAREEGRRDGAIGFAEWLAGNTDNTFIELMEQANSYLQSLKTKAYEQGTKNKQIKERAKAERIYEPKYGGKDHSGYDTLMKYEVNDEREECYEKGALSMLPEIEALEKRVKELEAERDKYKAIYCIR